MSTHYVGIDLHSKTSLLGVIDTQGQKVAEANLANDLKQILEFLQPFGPDLVIAIESTLNWYWLVDGLQQAGYQVQLAHTLGLYMISGPKSKPTAAMPSNWPNTCAWENSPKPTSTPRTNDPCAICCAGG